MEDKKRNTIYAVVIVGCLVLAGVITYVTRSPEGSGVPKHFAGQSIWVKCINQDCGATYEVDMKEFFSRVARFGSGRLMIEVPKKDRESFSKGDFVFVKKITPQEAENV